MRGGSQRVAATGLGLAVAAAALVMGILVVEEPGTIIPLTLELALLGGLTLLFLGRVSDRVLRRRLGRLAMAAILVRVALLVVVHFVFAQEFFAPDVASFEGQGRRLAAFWRGTGPDPELEVGTQVLYPYLNGVFAYLFQDPTFGVVVVNLFAGVWTVLLTFAIGRQMVEDSVAWIAALLVAFFPSLVLWSVLNVRDSLTTFAVVATVYLGLKAYRSPRLPELLGVAAGIVVLVGLRDYMGFLLLLGLGLGAVVVIRPGRVGVSLAMGTLFTLVLVLGVSQLGLFERVATESPLQRAQQLRTGLQQDFGGGAAGSAFGMGYDTSTPSGALRFLPVGLTYFLFAPFPWAIDSVLQLFTLPEVLVWYALVPFTVLGFWLAPKRGDVRIHVAIAVLAVVVVSYALVEGNVGTAYRHRAQVMPLFFIFTAAGLSRVWRGWRRRKEERAERIRAARSSLRRSGGRG